MGAFAEQRGRDLGVTEVRLYTNELMSENRPMYAALGDVRRDSGFSRVFMSKRLGE